MTNSLSKLEFPRKSKSRRMRIFRTRARKSINSLAASFYKKHDIQIPRAKLNSITDAIVQDLIELVVSKPEFLSQVLHPNIKGQEALLNRLVSEVTKAGDQLPVSILESDKFRLNSKDDDRQGAAVAKVAV